MVSRSFIVSSVTGYEKRKNMLSEVDTFVAVRVDTPSGAGGAQGGVLPLKYIIQKLKFNYTHSFYLSSMLPLSFLLLFGGNNASFTSRNLLRPEIVARPTEHRSGWQSKTLRLIIFLHHSDVMIQQGKSLQTGK